MSVLKPRYKTYCGSIIPSDEWYEGRMVCTFVPINSSIPEMNLYCKHPELLTDKRIRVGVASWTTDRPQARLVEIMGSVEDIVTESNAILHENDAITKQFTAKALA